MSLLTVKQYVVCVDGRVIDLHSLHIKVLLVLRIQHTTCDIRDVLPSVTFSGDVDFVPLHGKCFNEVLPETHELLRNIVLVINGYRSMGEPRADWLINVDHVGQINP